MTTTITTLPNSKIQIHTPRLLLRPAHPTDLHGLHTAFSSPAVMAYWSTPPHADLSVTQTWLDKMLVSPLNGVSDFIITLRPSEDGPSDRAIGKIGVWRDNEIGFLLAEEYWGRGFAREALTGMRWGTYLRRRKGGDEGWRV